jgi:hypothetical protein
LACVIGATDVVVDLVGTVDSVSCSGRSNETASTADVSYSRLERPAADAEAERIAAETTTAIKGGDSDIDDDGGSRRTAKAETAETEACAVVDRNSN